MAPNNNGQYGKILSTVLHVKEHEDSKASRVNDFNATEQDLKELLEKGSDEDTEGDE